VDRQIELSARIGHIWRLRFSRGRIPEFQYQLGNWHDALASAEEFLAGVEAGSPHAMAGDCYETRAQIRLARDDVTGALSDAERGLALARLRQDAQSTYTTTARCASVHCECGDRDSAAVLVDELLAELHAGTAFGWANEILHVLAWTAYALGKADELIEVLPKWDVPWVHAAAAFASGDFGRSADICADMGSVTEEARDRLWLGEALVKQNRRADADVQLQRALAFYRSVGATRYIREGEALLAASA
jgi:tetratricopeptide (TPR) repeat protein